MIRINKGLAPPLLSSKAKVLTDKLKLDYDKHKKKYVSGKKPVNITDDYKSEEVKIALVNCHKNKCCFSEAKFVGDYFHVEHFRPKARVDEYPKGISIYPGYYWLAYDWSNLFLCKSRINSTFKRNFFPLTSKSKRNLNHNDTNIEITQLIDPSAENPRKHIRFHQDEPIGKTKKGHFNIIFLGLRHPDFVEARSKRFQILKALKDSTDSLIANGISITNSTVSENINLLKAAILPEAEFSSMAKDFLTGWPHLK